MASSYTFGTTTIYTRTSYRLYEYNVDIDSGHFRWTLVDSSHADINIVVNLEMMIMNIHFCILMLYVLFIELHEKIDFLIDNIFVALALQSLSKGANYPVLLDNAQFVILFDFLQSPASVLLVFSCACIYSRWSLFVFVSFYF